MPNHGIHGNGNGTGNGNGNGTGNGNGGAAGVSAPTGMASTSAAPAPNGSTATRQHVIGLFADRASAELACRALADRGYREAIVAEPTQAQAVLAHRGISSARIAFKGRAGHASAPDALELSAVHQAMRWGAAALAEVSSQAHARFGGLSGLRFNIGRVEGGIKGNVIAPDCEARFNFRPLPSMDTDALHARFRACANEAALAAYE
jgi:acetylornithine deacetylase/succinyl-diaminopimelate desuccinylase-like protein